MISKNRCSACGAMNYATDPNCISCGAPMTAASSARTYHPVEQPEPAPGMNAVFAGLVLLVGISALAFTLGGLLNFYTAPQTADAPTGAVLGLPIGLLLIAAAVGLKYTCTCPANRSVSASPAPR